MNIINKIFDKTNNFFDKYFEPKRAYKNAAKNAHNYEINKSVLDILKCVDKIPHEVRYNGICSMFAWESAEIVPDGHFFREVNAALKTAFLEWPEYSGDQVFPVPAPPGFEPRHNHPQDSYHGRAYVELPRWEGEYSKSRQRLLDWLIVHFANKVHSTPYFPGIK